MEEMDVREAMDDLLRTTRWEEGDGRAGGMFVEEQDVDGWEKEGVVGAMMVVPLRDAEGEGGPRGNEEGSIGGSSVNGVKGMDPLERTGPNAGVRAPGLVGGGGTGDRYAR